MDNVLASARDQFPGDEEFLGWLEERVGQATAAYTVWEVYATLLGVSPRSYQAWENHPTFPVPDPRRVVRGRQRVRVYTPRQVARIANWYFYGEARDRRKMKKKGGAV